MTDQLSARSAMATAYELLFQALAARNPGDHKWYLSFPYPVLSNSKEAATGNALHLRMREITFPDEYFPSGQLGLQQISNAALVTYVLARDLAEKELKEIAAARQRTKRRTEVKQLEELIAGLPAWETAALVLVGAGHERQGNAEHEWNQSLTDAELRPWKAAEAIYASAQHQFEHAPSMNYLPENVKSEVRKVLFNGLVNTRIRLGLEAYRQGTQHFQTLVNKDLSNSRLDWNNRQSMLGTASQRFKEASALYDSAEAIYRQAGEKANITIKDDNGTPAITQEDVTKTFERLKGYIETARGKLAKLAPAIR